MSALNSFVFPGSANTFLALTQVNTTPAAGKVHVIGSWVICNNSGAPANVYATIRRGGVDTYQCNGFPLQAGDALFLHGLLGKVVLLAGDGLFVRSSVSGAVDVTVSIAEEP
jgi:hypothetical protein